MTGRMLKMFKTMLSMLEVEERFGETETFGGSEAPRKDGITS
jgi:hypothetical protein